MVQLHVFLMIVEALTRDILSEQSAQHVNCWDCVEDLNVITWVLWRQMRAFIGLIMSLVKSTDSCYVTILATMVQSANKLLIFHFLV